MLEKTREIIHEDHCRTIHELADTAGISYGVCQEMFTELLTMHRTAEAPHRKYKRLKLGGGHVYDCSSV
jgi:hypothetical protein